MLVGIHRDDGPEDMEYIVRKIVNLRIFDCVDNGKKWDKSVKDLDLEVYTTSYVLIILVHLSISFQILSVSQFTLYGQLKGNKVDFHNSMGPANAENFYTQFLEALKKAHKSDKIQVWNSLLICQKLLCFRMESLRRTCL